MRPRSQRNQLVEANLGLARLYARRSLRRTGPTFDDLVSVGNRALVDAARWWPGQGDFAAYAQVCVRRAIRRFAARQRARDERLPVQTNVSALTRGSGARTGYSEGQVMSDDGASSRQFEAIDAGEHVAVALRRLPLLDRMLLRCKYGLGRFPAMSYAELGEELGRSPQCVRKLLGGSEDKLRAVLAELNGAAAA